MIPAFPLLGAIELRGALGDVVYLAITAAFFATAQLLVRACDRLAGPNTTELTAPAEDPTPIDAAAPRQPTTLVEVTQ